MTIRKGWLREIVCGAAGILAAFFLLAQEPKQRPIDPPRVTQALVSMPVPVAGYWRAYDSAPEVYIPCPGHDVGTVPYLTWINPAPGDGQPWYLRGDMNPNPPTPGAAGMYLDAIFGNHTRAYISWRGFHIPMMPQLGPANHYPPPTATDQLCTQWVAKYGAFQNTTTCPGGSPSQYSTQFKNVDVWQQAYNFYLPRLQADCNHPQPTATPVATPSPVPGRADTANFEALYAAGITAGCNSSPLMACPDQLMTRAQVAVWLSKGLKLPILACQGVFADMKCPSPALQGMPLQ